MKKVKITGYPIKFAKEEERMLFTEIIDPHAFDNVKLTNIRLINLTNSDCKTIARTNNRTLKLTINENGLFAEAKIDPNINYYDMGIRFTVKREMWERCDTEHPTRIIKEIDKIHSVTLFSEEE